MESLYPNQLTFSRKKKILAKIKRIPIETNCKLDIQTESQIKKFRNGGDDYLSLAADRLAKNPSRNQLLLSAIKNSFDEGDSILVFACNVDHCIILEALLRY